MPRLGTTPARVLETTHTLLKTGSQARFAPRLSTFRNVPYIEADSPLSDRPTAIKRRPRHAQISLVLLDTRLTLLPVLLTLASASRVCCGAAMRASQPRKQGSWEANYPGDASNRGSNTFSPPPPCSQLLRRTQVVQGWRRHILHGGCAERERRDAECAECADGV